MKNNKIKIKFQNIFLLSLGAIAFLGVTEQDTHIPLPEQQIPRSFIERPRIDISDTDSQRCLRNMEAARIAFDAIYAKQTNSEIAIETYDSLYACIRESRIYSVINVINHFIKAFVNDNNAIINSDYYELFDFFVKELSQDKNKITYFVNGGPVLPHSMQLILLFLAIMITMRISKSLGCGFRCF